MLAVAGLLVVLAMALLLLTRAALAATFVVDTFVDAVDASVGDGICATASGDCSLRAAIQEANATPAADVITVPAGTYRLTIEASGANGIDSGDLDIERPVTINGAGAAATVVDGGVPGPNTPPEFTAIDRLFELHPTAGAVRFHGVTVQGGYSDESGGAIANFSTGTVRLVDSIVRDSEAVEDGGGIANEGTLILERTTVRDNHAGGTGGGIYTTAGALTLSGTVDQPSRVEGNAAADGAGVYHGGELTPLGLRSSVTVTRAVFADNEAEGDGGALINSHEGVLTMSDTEVTGNLAHAVGGGVISEGKASATITRVTFSENEAVEDGAGALYIGGERPSTVTDSTFSGNRAGEDGGAILSEGMGSLAMSGLTVEQSSSGGEGGGIYLDNNGPVTLTDSTIRDNFSAAGGGGIENAAMRVTFRRLQVHGNRTTLNGGGIESQGSSDFFVLDSNIYNNTAENGGGITNDADGRMLVSGTAVYGNRARAGNNEDTGLGGGILILGDAGISIENSTFSGNSAQVRGGGIHVDADADTHVTNVTVTRNSAPVGSGVAGEEGSPNFPITPSTDVIFRNSIVADNRLGEQCSFALGSEGGNIDSGDSCYFRGLRDRRNADPGLDAIADNGGPSLTHALRTESLAVNAGVAPCLLTDQRGVSRPQSWQCDSGAYEFEGPFLPQDEEPPNTIFDGGPVILDQNTSAFYFSGTDNMTDPADLLYECKLIEFDPAEEPEIPDPTVPIPPEFDWQTCDSPWEVKLIDEGWWTFEVRAIDRQGNVDPTPVVHEFHVEEDMTPPTVTLTETPPNPSYGRSATFSFAGTDNVTPTHLIEFECRLDSNDPDLWLECSNPMVYTNLTTGEHRFQVRAVDLNDNVSPTLTYVWNVAPPLDCDQANITLTASKDVFVDQITPFENKVLEQNLVVRSDGPARNARALYGFDLPNDAPECQLESATLRLYAGSSTPGRSLEAVPLAGSWAENTATWMNQPGTAGTPATTLSGDGYREWNVTEHVLAMTDGALDNHGWVIRDAEENDGVDGGDQSFHSREVPQVPGVSTLPRLVLRYEPAGGPPPEPPTAAEEETQVACGQVITQSTTLANDLNGCMGEGLVIGAPNIVLDLNGHTITSGAPVEPGEEDGLIAGIRNGGHRNVVIRGGTVKGFGYGVRLFGGTTFNVVEDMHLLENVLVGVELVDADDGRNGNTIRDNEFDGNETGITLVDDSENTVVTGNDLAGNVGMGVLVHEGRGHRIEGNTVNGYVNNPLLDSDGGIRLTGSRDNVVRGNYVEDTGDGGIILDSGSNRNLVEGNTGVRAGDAAVTISDSDDNTVTRNVGHLMADAGIVLNNANNSLISENDVRFNPAGIEIEGSEANRVELNDASDNQGDGIIVGSGLQNVIIDNVTNSNKGAGILVEGEATDTQGNPIPGNIIRRNTAISNLADGIAVAAGGHRIGSNSAHHNAGWGISADEGAVDEGGNTASGNAEPEQCRGVACATGDGVPPIPEDITPPTTVITDGPSDPSDFMSATFHFTGNDDRTPATALRFECRLDPLPDPPIEEPDPPEPGEIPDPVDPTDPDSWTECVSPVTYELLDEGEHRFEVRAIDANDNRDYSGDAYWEWTVINLPGGEEDDDLPPTTTISAAPDNPSASRDATFRFRGSDNITPGAFLTYECRLDGGAWEECTSPVEFTSLSLGEHTFEVRAIDLGGNVDPTPATHTWTIIPPPPDDTPPETTIDSGPDTVTVQTSATFTFSSNESPATFECQLDGGAWQPCTSPYTYDGLSVAEHTLRVRATDAAGNTDPTPASYTWTVSPEPVPAELECGAVITQSTRLTDDLSGCPENGVVIGAPGITLDLDGHTIAGVGLGAGVLNEGHNHVTVTGGTVQAFDYGVLLGAGTVGNVIHAMTLLENQDGGLLLANAGDATSGNTVRENLVTGNGAGVVLNEGTRRTLLRDNTIAANPGEGVLLEHANHSRVEGNVIAATGDAGMTLVGASHNRIVGNVVTETADAGLSLVEASNNNVVRGNTVTEGEAGFIVYDSDHNVVEQNVANETSDIGLKLENSHNNELRDNDLRRNAGGMQLDGSSGNLIEGNDASESSGTGFEIGDLSLDNTIRGNVASFNEGEGISIGAQAPPGDGNLIEGNITNTNGATGIAVETVGHMIRGNTANDNDGWGIYSAQGSVAGLNIDGGGNRAFGNTELLQCSNVRCDGGEPFPSDPTPPETSVIDGPTDPTFQRSATFVFAGTDNATRVTFECRLDGAAWEPCTSPVTYTGLALGDHVFEVRAIDWSGNIDPTPATWEWMIIVPPPGEAPETTIGSAPDAATTSTEASFTFSSNEPDVTFECRLDEGAWEVCASPKTYSGLPLGSHTFAVRAIDDEGLVDDTPATFTWTITAPPVAATVSCGQTLTQSTLVLNDLLNCPGDGLVIGANGITVDLGGRVVDGTGLGAGVRNNGFDGVLVRNGAVQEFDYGITLGAGSSGNVVAGVTAQANQDGGVLLDDADQNGVGNTLRGNIISNNSTVGVLVTNGTAHAALVDNTIGSNAGEGVHVTDASAARIESNRITGSSRFAVLLEGSGGHVVLNNTLTGNSGGAVGVGTDLAPSNDNRIQGNVVSSTGSTGMLLVGSTGNQLLNNTIGQSGNTAVVLEFSSNTLLRANDIRSNAGGIAAEGSSGNRIEANNTSANLGAGMEFEAASFSNTIIANMSNSNNGEGIYVTGNAPTGQGNLIERNTATSNADDGIAVEGSGHTITRNTADYNGGWGIYAVNGNTDGGGNRATGNAESAQCFNIVCEIGVPAGAPDTEIVMKPPSTSNSMQAIFTFTGYDDIDDPWNLSFECRLDSSSEADWFECDNPQIYTNLSPGTHRFEVRAIDQQGFIDPTPAEWTWTYVPLPSGVAPDTFIDIKPPLETWNLEAIFTFSSNEPDVTFECRLDGGPWTACAFFYEAEFEDFQTGLHTFEVRAIDFEGNVDPTPASYTWRILGVLTTITDGPAYIPPTEPGEPAQGGETIETHATLEFEANVEEAEFFCSLDLAPFEPCTSPITYPGPLAVGEHLFRVYAVDLETGREEEEPAEYEWTVILEDDVTPPDTEITLAPASGSSDVVLEFTGTDDRSFPEWLEFECRLVTAITGTTVFDWTGCVSPFNLLVEFPELTPGSYTFEVRAIDEAGNVDPAPAAHTWTLALDTVAPNTIIISGPPALTGEIDVLFDLSATDNTTPAELLTFECELAHDGVVVEPWAPCDSPHSVQGLDPGHHELRVRATDLAGNVEDAPALWTWEVVGAPVTTILTGPGEDPDYTVDVREATFTFTSDQSDRPELGVTFTCSIDGSDFEPCTSPYELRWLTDGSHTLEVRAVNVFDLTDTDGAEWTWSVVDAPPDSEAPETTILTGPAEGSTTVSRAAAFTFASNKPFSTFECSLDGGPFETCSGSSPYQVQDLPDGSHTFAVRAIDQVGNVDPTPATRTWTVDGLPMVTILTGPEGATESTTATFTFEADEPNVTFECWLDGPLGPCTSPKTFTGLTPRGPEYVFGVRAIDAAGNVGPWADWEWEILPSEAPVVTFTSGPDPVTASRSVRLEFAGSDNTTQESELLFECSLNGSPWSECLSPVELFDLPLGSYTLRVRATDLAGNVSAVASYSWSVVESTDDTFPPETMILSGPPSIATNTTVTFTFTASEGSTFECSLDGSPFVACESPVSYNNIQPGTHTFRVRATDEAGNTDPTPASYTWTYPTGPASCPTTTYAATADSWVDQGSPNTNKGTDSNLKVMSKGPSNNLRALVRFQLPTTPPAGCEVQSATLRMHAKGSRDGRTIQALRVTGAWTESGVTWANQPLTASNAATVPSGQGWREWNVTAHANDIFSTGNNQGWLIRDSAENQDAEQQFDSREASAANRPQLVVAYRSTVTPGDTTPPETMITAGPPSTTSSTAATFRFAANESGSTFQCSLDGAAFATCTSPHEYTGLAEGEHTFRVRATDLAGNVDPTPASYTWTVLGSVPPPTPTSCGQVVTSSMTLTQDMLNCLGDGLIVGADGITINLNGRTVDGVGLGVGIRNDGYDAVTITGGTVQHFDEGVQLGAGTRQNVVSGLTLQGNDLAGVVLAGAGGAGGGNEARDNTLTDNGVGLSVVGGASHNTLVGNTISLNSGEGVLVTDSSNNTILDNSISTDGDAGVALEQADSNTVAENEVTGSSDQGIRLVTSSGNTVRDNHVHDTNDAGIALTDASNDNTVRSNTLTNTGDAGVSIQGSDGTDVLGNTVTLMGDSGIGLDKADGSLLRGNDVSGNPTGIELNDSSDNVVELNDASENDGVGIVLDGVSLRNVVERNTANDNLGRGLAVAPETDAAHGNLLDRNVANGNGGDGIYVAKAGHSLIGNTANGNQGWGIWADPATNDGGGNTAAGNAESAQCAGIACNVAPDTTPPNTSITSGPSSSTATTAEFEFESDEAGSTFECSLDDAPFSACSSPKSYTGLEPGEHTFAVRATDTAGNTDATPAVWTWTVDTPDTTPPKVTLTSTPAAETSSTTAEFTFEADEDNVTFTCSFDGEPLSGCSSPTQRSALSIGLHSFTVLATDAAGNTSTPATHTWTITPPPDTTPPVVSIDVKPPATTTSSTATFEFSADEPGTFLCSLDGGDPAACVSPKTYTDLPLGEHTFAVQGIDAAGNTSSPITHTWTITTTPGGSCEETVHTLDAVADTYVQSNQPTSNHGSSSTLNVSARVNSTRRALVRFESLPDVPAGCQLVDAELRLYASQAKPGRTLHAARIADSWEEGAVTWGNHGQLTIAGPEVETASGNDWRSWSVTGHVEAMYAAGVAHGFRIKDASENGNHDQTFSAREGGEAQRPQLVLTFAAPDTTPPAVAITSNPSTETTATSASFSFSADEDVSWECRLDTQEFAECTSPATYSGLSTGQHTFAVRATDGAGNTSDAVTYTWMITARTCQLETLKLPAVADSYVRLDRADTNYGSDAALLVSARTTVTRRALLDFDLPSMPEGCTVISAQLELFASSVNPNRSLHAHPISQAWSEELVTWANSPQFDDSRVGATSGTGWRTWDVTTLLADAYAAHVSAADNHGFMIKDATEDGTHDQTFVAREGTEEQAPRLVLTIAPTPPVVEIDTKPASSTDTSATFSFSSGDADATFQCSLDDTPFTACTSPTTYSGLMAGEHTFEVRGLSPEGIAGPVKQHRWTVQMTCAAATITLQASADSYVQSNQAGTNFGGATTLGVSARTNTTRRALVQFDLPQLPAGCEITDAQLRLSSSGAKANRTLQAYQVATSWTESGVTWSNQPTTTGAAATTASGTGWRIWSVTDMVRAMTTGANHGFLIRDAAEDGNHDQTFTSREGAAEQRPELVVIITPTP